MSFRIVFQVGVLNNDDLSGNVLDGRPQCRTFALVASVAKRADWSAFQISNQIRGSVCGAVVDDDDLVTHPDRATFLQPADQRFDRR